MTALIVHPRIAEAERKATEHLILAEAAQDLNHRLMRLLQQHSWEAFMARCYHCEGHGAVPAGSQLRIPEDEPDAVFVSCYHCQGTGDLDGARLRQAYLIGFREALAELGALHEWMGKLVDRQSGYSLTHLKAKVAR